MTVTMCNDIPPKPPDAAVQDLPYVVVSLIMGGHVIEKLNDGDGFGIMSDNGMIPLAHSDYDTVKIVAERIESAMQIGRVGTIQHAMEIPQ